MKRTFISLMLGALAIPVWAADPQVPYPSSYRDWQHVKSMVIDEGHPLFGAFGGIHHLYANPKEALINSLFRLKADCKLLISLCVTFGGVNKSAFP